MMIGYRKSTRMKLEVFKLKKSGHGIRKIAQILSISRNTVKGILRDEEPSLINPGDVPEAKAWSETIPWSEIQKELSKPHISVKQLALEYAPEGIPYLRFWRELKRQLPKDLIQQVRVRMHHKAEDRFEIDYTDGLMLTDRKSGNKLKTQLFLAVSSATDYVYAEFRATS